MSAVTQGHGVTLSSFDLAAVDAGASPLLTQVPGAEADFEMILRCKAVIPITHDVSTFALEPTTPHTFFLLLGSTSWWPSPSMASGTSGATRSLRRRPAPTW